MISKTQNPFKEVNKVKRKIFSVLIALVLGTSLLLAACAAPAPAPAVTATPRPSPPPEVIPTPAPTSLEVNLGSEREGIWVSGTGEVTVTPDIANLRLGIQAQEASVAEAQTKAYEAMDKVMTALTDSSVAEKDIQTQYFKIRQRTKWDREKEEEIVIGYQVTNMVIAKIRDIDKVGAIIDAVVKAGGDLIRIDSIDFSVDDPSVYYEEAREKAMVDAKARADNLAQLAGVTLGKPTYVSEGVQQPIYKRVYYEQAGGAPVPAPAPAPTPPISPGEMKVSITVQVAYSILQ